MSRLTRQYLINVGSEKKSGMSAFYYVGLLCSVYAAVHIFRYLSTLVRRGLKVEELGDWALVTGATDGIGKAFVKAGIYILHRNNSFNIISPIGEIKLCVCQGGGDERYHMSKK